MSDVKPWYGYQDAIDARYVVDPQYLFELRHHPVRYLSRYTQKSYTFEVGFRWDGASVPGFSLVGIADRLSAFPAALAHDYLIRYQIETPGDCDAVFLEIMAGVFHERTKYHGYSEPEWRARIMHAAVSLFGPHHAQTLDLSGEGFQLPLGD